MVLSGRRALYPKNRKKWAFRTALGKNYYCENLIFTSIIPIVRQSSLVFPRLLSVNVVMHFRSLRRMIGGDKVVV